MPRAITRVLDEPLEIEGHTGAYSDHAGLLGEFELAATTPAPVRPDAVSMARTLLRAGRNEALRRQHDQRVHAAFGLAAAPLAWLTARSSAISRRRFLRTCALGTAGLAGAFGFARLALTESLRPPELAGFNAALARLDTLAAQD